MELFKAIENIRGRNCGIGIDQMNELIKLSNTDALWEPSLSLVCNAKREMYFIDY